MYCDYRDQNTQTAVNVLGSVLRQLLRHPANVPTAVWQSYDDHVQRQQTLDLAEVQRLLELVSSEYEHIYICLDALDELAEITSVLQYLQNGPLNMHLFLTARPHIQATLEKYLANVPIISIEAHESDIVLLIDREIGGPEDAEPVMMNDELRVKIQQKICESAKGK